MRKTSCPVRRWVACTRASRCFSALIAAALLLGAPFTGLANVFTSTTAITIPGSGTGAANPGAASSPYGTTISVSGLSGNITQVTVSLNNLSHAFPDDLDILLVGPTGANLVLTSDAGGGGDLTNFTISFSDAGATMIADTGTAIVNGTTYLPSNYLSTANSSNNDNWPAPAPAASGNTTFATPFNGTNGNGIWTLYVIDDASAETGTMGGWSIDITASASTHSTATALATTDPDYEVTGNPITFTATVTDTVDSDSVGANGSVTFRDGATVLMANVALNASGMAQFTTSSLPTGNRAITATYNPTSAFTGSVGSLTQVVDGPTTQAGNTFTNATSIAGPAGLIGVHAPYASHLNVAGLAGTISMVTVTLSNLSQTSPDDYDILLVSPDGTRNLVVMSDSGQGTASGVTLTFSDAAASSLPDAAALTTGSFKPTNNPGGGGETFPAPAPAASAQTTLAGAFNGASPNGVWRLYVVDDVGGDTGSITGGWSMTFATSATEVATATTLTDNDPDFATTGQNLTLTATVTSGGNPVASGTVTFRDGASILAANVALNGSGQATFSTSTLPLGTRNLAADYNGVPGSFSQSSGADAQIIDYPTTQSGRIFSNTGSRTIPAPGLTASNSPAEIYPTHIAVTGLSNPLGTVVVTISGLTHTAPDDLEFLLVGPNGQSVVLISDVGGSSGVSNTTLTLDDAAAAGLADAGPLSTGTFKPTDIGPNDPLPSPAPAPPYTGTTLGVFSNTTANGIWRLYVADDANGNTGSFTGWSLTLNVPPTVSNISKSGNEDSQIAFTAADFDAGFADTNAGDTLQTVRVTSLPANGTLKLNNVNVTLNQNIPRANLATLTFDPTLHFNGPTSFGWNGSDGALFAASGALVNINVISVNDNPVAGADTISRRASQSAKVLISTLLGNDMDIDGGTVAFVSVPAVSAGGQALAASGGYVFYNPAPNFIAADSFTYTINDGQGGTAMGTVNVQILVDDAPSSNQTRIQSEPASGGGTQRRVSFAGIPGRTYRVQSTDSLAPANWVNRATVIANAQGAFEFVDPPPLPPTRFYRSISP